MNIFEILLGQIPEALYFALFLIYVKSLNCRKFVFILLILVEYLLLLYLFPYNWLFHICFVVMTFLTLKILYKNRAQITDVFILAIAYLYLGATSIISFVITNGDMLFAIIINRILIFAPIIIFKHKLRYIQILYKRQWNRESLHKKIKATTFRSLNLVIFNIMFYLINFCMVIGAIMKAG